MAKQMEWVTSAGRKQTLQIFSIFFNTLFSIAVSKILHSFAPYTWNSFKQQFLIEKFV